MSTIRRLADSDRELLFRWRNEPSVAQWMLTDHEITWDEHKHWFEGVLYDDTCAYWVILDAGRPIGVVNLARIDRATLSCELGIYVGEPVGRGRGFSASALRKVLTYAFDKLDLAMVVADVFAENEAGIRLYSQVGFVRVRADVPAVVKKGVERRLVRMAISSAGAVPDEQGGDAND